ncbi:MAG: AMP-binding protein [Oscillospiraceae bacterium]|nr:AMP-binding protein [Oscillospiraceae bacterium]
MLWDFAKFGNRPFATDDSGEIYRYDTLLRHGEAFADAVGERCLIFILCTNSAGSILGYTAALNHGIVPVLVDSGLERSLLHSLLDTYQPKYLWLPEKNAAEFPGYTAGYGEWGYTLLRAESAPHCELYGDLALLLTTSGSTGSPKLVRQSYDNILANTESIVEYLHIDGDERPITTLPMHYTYGLSVLNTHLFVGAEMILTEHTLMQKEFWARVKDERVTSFAGVPYIYEMLNRLRFFRMDLPDLKTLTQAGGKLSVELHEKFADFAAQTGKHFVVMYGQTEATARMAYLPPEYAVRKRGSMGIAIPGGEFSLIDACGEPITQPDTVGELVYTGRNVTLGYAEQREDLAKGDERCGVLQTGDMAKVDSDGFYYIVGRKKRFLKVFGSRINLDETERLVSSAFDGISCVCAGKDDHMYVFLTDDKLKEEVLKFLSQKTGFHPSAFTVCIIDAIPRNESGKIVYQELAKYYEE